MDAATVAVYEAHAADYLAKRRAVEGGRAAAFGAAVGADALRLDLGAGPGLYLDRLGGPVVAGDAAIAMCGEARRRVPGVAAVVHDLEALPFRGAAFGGVWASKCLQHVAADRLPGALAEVHRVLAVGGRFDLTAFASAEDADGRDAMVSGGDLPGRLFTFWSPEALGELLVGAGFDVEAVDQEGHRVTATATRARSLPDVVGPGMRLLVCGLNPSLYAADAGVAYARPGNRFWPAALAAGLVSVDRDPRHALHHHGIGFTDLVKRATVGAEEITDDEYRAGVGRVERLVTLVRPRAVAICGLTGWRRGVDRAAVVGVQPGRLGGRPVYLVPNPSGRNAHVRVGDIAAHLATAALGGAAPLDPS